MAEPNSIPTYVMMGLVIVLVVIATVILFKYTMMPGCSAKKADPKTAKAAQKLKATMRATQASKDVRRLQDNIAKAKAVRDRIKNARPKGAAAPQQPTEAAPQQPPEAAPKADLKPAAASLRAPKDKHAGFNVDLIKQAQSDHALTRSESDAYDMARGGLANAQNLARKKRMASRKLSKEPPSFKEKLKDLEADMANAAVSVCGGIPPAGAGDIEGVLKCNWNPDQSVGCSGAGISPSVCLDEESAWGSKELIKLFSNPHKNAKRNVARRYGTLFVQHRFNEDHPLRRLPDFVRSFGRGNGGKSVCNMPAIDDDSFMPAALPEKDCEGTTFCNLHCSNFSVEGELFNRQADSLPLLLWALLNGLAPGGVYDESDMGLFIDLMSSKQFDKILVDAVQPRLQLTPGCDINPGAANCRPRELKNYSKANIYCAVSSNGNKYLPLYTQALMDMLLVDAAVDGSGARVQNKYHISNIFKMGSAMFNRLLTVLLAPMPDSASDADKADVMLVFIDTALQAMAEVALKDKYSCIFQAHVDAEHFGTESYDQGKPQTVAKIMRIGDRTKVSEGNADALVWSWRHWK